ncbi:MAG: hydantoinase/oxoprolinase family protein [Hyphomicrobium sp.]
MSITVGFDVGGAHLKVARLDDRCPIAVRQIACPLWQGLDTLDAALAEARDLIAGADHYAVTMTGELVEIFPSREEGALELIQRLAASLGPSTQFYMGLKGFASAPQAARDPLAVASANFLATASSIAALRKDALLIDMGSTTTDIIPCDRPQGVSDAERLQTGELVYTGMTRTPVASVTTRAPLLGSWQSLARDTFATMSDVRRILGELPDGVDQHATSDGRGKSIGESLVRFARGFGRDGEERHLAGWQAAAAYVRECQLRSLYDGAIQVISRPGLDVSGGVVAAGIGAPVAEAIARRLGLPSITYGGLIAAPVDLRLWVTRCAPAVAVALSSLEGSSRG